MLMLTLRIRSLLSFNIVLNVVLFLELNFQAFSMQHAKQLCLGGRRGRACL